MLENFRISFLLCASSLFLPIIAKAASSPVVIRQMTQRYKDVGAKDQNAIACLCPNGTTIQRYIDRMTAAEILSSSRNCFHAKDVCNLMDSCDSCIIYSEFCEPSSDGVDFDCLRDIFILRRGYFKQRSSETQYRFKRHLSTCNYPTNLKTADVFCQIGARSVHCKQTCITGYTFKHGTERKLKCKRHKNKWKPHNFMECQPYVDCTVSLVSAGVADCYTPTTKLHAMCYIQCEAYEDNDEVPRRAYTCKRNGKWKEGLPHCAAEGSNIALVDPPKD